MSDIIGLLLTWSLPVATLALALGTFRLARHTRKMAESTEKALKQNAQILENEERHHQENLRPICIFEYDSSKPLVNFEVDSVVMSGYVVNKGHGTSVEGMLYLIMPSSMTYISIELPSLSGSDRWLEISYYNTIRNIIMKEVFIPIRNCDARCAETIINAYKKNEIIIFIRYKDLFGNWLGTNQVVNSNSNQFSVTLINVDAEAPIQGLHCLNSLQDIKEA